MIPALLGSQESPSSFIYYTWPYLPTSTSYLTLPNILVPIKKNLCTSCLPVTLTGSCCRLLLPWRLTLSRCHQPSVITHLPSQRQIPFPKFPWSPVLTAGLPCLLVVSVSYLFLLMNGSSLRAGTVCSTLFEWPAPRTVLGQAQSRITWWKSKASFSLRISSLLRGNTRLMVTPKPIPDVSCYGHLFTI